MSGKAVRETLAALGVIASLVLAGCGDSGTEPMEFPPMPFDPTGTWSASVEGLLHGSQEEHTMVIALSVLGDYTASGGPVELSGSWDWQGLTGIVDGFWEPQRDAAARDSTDGGGFFCPDSFTSCSLRLNLRQPTGSCAELLNPGINTINLFGWFDGPTLVAAASLQGTYWEGTGNDTQPCAGPVLISLDTSAWFVPAS